VYDIVPDDHIEVRQPDILILEGLNVLQVGGEYDEFVSDYFDFSIYVDAEETDIQQWYIDRFLMLRETVFKNPDSFFKNYAHLTHEEAIQTAQGIWQSINGKNLVENIAPTRDRASLIVEKGNDHRVNNVFLRRL
jgi:type I pantothenate kinase